MKRFHSTKKCPKCGKLFKNGITGGNNLGRASLCDGCTHDAVKHFTFHVEFVGKLHDSEGLPQALPGVIKMISMNWIIR